MKLLWDIANSSGAVVSGAGALATMDCNLGPGQGGIRGNIGQSSGLLYFELGVALFDGISVGVTTTNANKFPGLLAKGVSQDSGGHFIDGVHNGGGGPSLTLAQRVGVKVRFGNGPSYIGYTGPFVELISTDHPEGTDILPYDFAGSIVYPSIGIGFGNGAAHICSATLYGALADFILPHDPTFLPWGPIDGSLLALL